ncbi:hypothetical protein [Mesoflavibacter sp. SCSIO 43206]|uniref:hypothetical protein n=1 Tax=Mesoflavibacter sp. SCSIO 43206 TaxID=2779362 RepID=UPI001CAA0EE1|nr:hypothetical protein [Mesoflavibacter sp. SCSIO 43206]UAB75576.1 hypothetical protein INR78_00900 [Mesoflavibacter sp. SCSIO 43206]UAB75671.1 hypothetical protein INR78_01380 [Mesoflavibacter sp. SCSIO 43206]
MKIVTSIIILLLTLSCSAQEKKCAKFKVGRFEYSDPRFSEWKVSRTDSMQTEISTKSGIEIFSSIEWKSECEYVLTYRKVLNSGTDTNDIIGKTIEVEIVETKSDRYICKSKSDVMDLELEMIRVK